MPQQRLKIAVLIKRFIATGGAERYAVEVARRLADRGHRIDLYAREAEEGLVAGIRFVKIPDRLRFSSVLNSWSFARQTARRLAGGAYDVIFSHERGFSQDLAAIHTFSYRLGLENISFLKKINSLYLSPRSWLHLRLERQQMESAWLVPVSNTIKDGIARYYRRTENVAVATPGVDVDFFNPAWIRDHRNSARDNQGLTPDELAVLFVGSEFKRKGLDDLIRAIRPGMHLIVVGGGERTGYYRRLVASCGATDRVAFRGLTDDVRRCYAAADVVVLPSLRAFGMSILEGMACGLPVISSAAAGVSGLLDHGVNGYVFNRPGELAGLLENLKSPDLRQALGVQARRTAKAHTWEKTADVFEKVCREIAGQKQPGRHNRHSVVSAPDVTCGF